jgi:sugar lactone lactonase YvrE
MIMNKKINLTLSLFILLQNLSAYGGVFNNIGFSSQAALRLLAGSMNGPGSLDGLGANALFNQPSSSVVDSLGNIFVTDSKNNTIRKITSAGVVTTFAGAAGVAGSTNGTGSAARFNFPWGIAIDSGNNLFVADSGNQVIRKITSAAVVTTFAGTLGTPGSADGAGTAASFADPAGLAIDASGNIYVADGTNHTIRKITSAGVVSTFAGSAGNPGFLDGTGAAAKFSGPMGIAIDLSSNLYVANYNNHNIRKITSSGVVTTIAGVANYTGSGDGNGSGTAYFFNPNTVAIDSGNIYVADTGNNAIRKITAAGVSSYFAGVAPGTDGTGAAARFLSPNATAIDSAGTIYIADAKNNIIRKITTGGVVTTLAGTAGLSGAINGTGAAARFNNPQGIAVDSSLNVYVADTDNQIIRKITSAGVVTTLAGAAGNMSFANATGTAAMFCNPKGVAVDSTGNVFVADSCNYLIRKITTAGIVTTLAGTLGTWGNTDGNGTAAVFDSPSGLAIDITGKLYVTDTGSSTIRKISSTTVSTLAGAGYLAGYGDGQGSAALFNAPTGITVDSGGNVYVADSGNFVIRKITSGGAVTTLAGTATISGSSGGIGTAASFMNPTGISTNGSNLYVADQGSNNIRQIVISTKVVTTLAGPQAGANGTGAAVSFSGPQGVAVDSSGNVYVADSNNYIIRKITSAGVATTLAGTAGVYVGNVDGTGAAAGFSRPTDLVADGSGNIFVLDRTGSIRKITPAGVVTTVTTNFSLTNSRGIALDSVGNIYVAASFSNQIKKITQAGVVTTFAGSTVGSTDGIGTAAKFKNPEGLAIDASGNLYVSDTNNRTIRKITAAGVVSTLAGTAGSGGFADEIGPNATFSGSTNGLAVDSSGNVFVAEPGYSSIRKITPSAVVTTFAGTPGFPGSADGSGSPALFNGPTEVAVDSSGNLYVVDTHNSTIRKVTPAGLVSTIAGTAGIPGSADGTGAAARFFNPNGVSLDSTGNLYVADLGNSSLRKITSSGVVTTIAGSGQIIGAANGIGAAATFENPSGVAVDGSGNVFIADSGNHIIRKITSAGVVTTLAGTAGNMGAADGTGSAASFISPTGIAVDGASNIYVADSSSSTIRKITSGGVVTTLAGSPITNGSANGIGVAATFMYPTGVAVDTVGNVYVADNGNSLIRKITSAGVVSTLAGTAGLWGTTNGTGPTARFTNPFALAVDVGGNVYVADSGNHLIRKITSAGVVTTLAGTAGVAGSVNGTGTAAKFNYPTGVSVDGSGNVYVADNNNSTIRKITSAGVVTTVLGVALSSGNIVGSIFSGNIRLGMTKSVAYVPSRLIILINNGVFTVPLAK